MFDALKKIFKKEDKKEKTETALQVSDSAGQEGIKDVAEVEELEYESE